MRNNIREIFNLFFNDRLLMTYKKYGEGHINETYLLKDSLNEKWILQKINENVFLNVDELMENIVLVTDELKRNVEDRRSALSLKSTLEGKSYLKKDGEAWRIYEFVEDSFCLQGVESPIDFYESGVAFARFGEFLSSFDATSLHETIKDFHNTPKRYSAFKSALDRDELGRAKEVKREIDFFLEREGEASKLERMKDEGYLPLRVTHNDTKLNNVLFDKKTRKALCVIDLDTVMPGLSLFDFGDSIRFGASSALEDEVDIDKVWLETSLLRAFAEGFIKNMPSLTKEEKENLALGAKIMTLECGLRFLTDYLEGDKYFQIHRSKHNLDRARTQIKLVSDMETEWNDIYRIIKEI